MPFDRFLGRFSADLAIDLGTCSIRVCETTRGIVVNEPSVVAMFAEDGEKRLVALGHEAREMIGRTHSRISTIRPINAGAISDFEVTDLLLRHFILQSRPRSFLARPRVIIAVSGRATDVERRALRESASSAGARKVFMIAEPLAAAIGAGLPISEPTGHMVLSIGGGTTQMSVVSMFSVVDSHCIKPAGDDLTEDILQYVKRKHDLLIGRNLAEEIKLKLAAASQDSGSETMEVKGRDLAAGLPRRIVLHSGEVWEAIRETLLKIADAVNATLEMYPPERIETIRGRGITLTGGGSLLRGLDIFLQNETGLTIRTAPNPVDCVVIGSAMVLRDRPLLKRVASRN